MFEDSLFASSGKLRTSSPLTVVLSFFLQSIAVGIMVLIPLLYTEALPARQLIGILITPPPPPAPRTQTAASPAVHVLSRPGRQEQEFSQPIVIPKHAAKLHETPLPPIVFGGVTNQPDWAPNAPANLLSGAVTVAPPPPPPPPQRIHVGGQVAAARLIYEPKPVYPAVARQARIQGAVRLQAIISKEGAIRNLAVLAGHPMLIPAALEAVRQWRYQPTLLNGVPVQVETTIEVNFRLGG